MIRIVLADDHRIVLDGLDQVLRLEPDLAVVGRCETGAAAVQAVRTGRPDILLLDLAMPDLDGLGVLQALQAIETPTRTIVLTAHVDSASAGHALRLGAAAVVFKHQDAAELVSVIRDVAAGRVPAHGLLRPAPPAAVPAGVNLLTPREREIVRVAALGLRNREIAARLDITEGTVKLHLHNIYEKLGVNGRPELVSLAIRLGLS